MVQAGLRKMDGYVTDEAFNGMAASSYILPLGYFMKTICEWGMGLCAVRGLWRCLRYDQCFLGVWDEPPGTSAMILQFEDLLQVKALEFWQ